MTAETAKAKNLTLKKLSGTKFRQMLRAGEVRLRLSCRVVIFMIIMYKNLRSRRDPRRT